MRPLRFVLLLPCSALLLTWIAAPARADSIQTFALDGNGSQSLSGNTLTVTLDDVELDGVTFDAVLTVTGSGNLTQTSSGLGVSGGGSALINDGESLTWSLAIEDVSGGTVTFEGFTGLDFTFFGASAEKAVFSLDGSLSTTCDNFLTAIAPGDPDISATSPTAFTLFGQDNGGVTTSFRIDSIDGAFSTAAPVPEPGSLALLSFAAVVAGAGARHRRRRARRAPEVAQSGRGSRTHSGM